MEKTKNFIKIILVIIILFLFTSCGYQVVREKGIYSGDIASISVPVFKNKTYEPHASSYFTDAFTKNIERYSRTFMKEKWFTGKAEPVEV